MGRASLLLATALITGTALLAPAAGAATTGTRDACATATSAGAREEYYLRTFHIEAKAREKIVKRGDKVHIEAQVTRPAKEDPLTLGLPWERPFVEPAADVSLGVGLLAQDVYLPGSGTTDENGEVAITIKIEKYAKPGPVVAAFYAKRIVHQDPCFKIIENGFRPYRDFFTIE